MEQVEQHNPAGRLHALVSRVIKQQRRMADKPCLQLWAAVFDLSLDRDEHEFATTLYEVISRLLQIEKLIDDTENGLRKIDGLPDRYFRPFERIRALPVQSLKSLSSNIAATVNAISDGDMTVLEFCAERLEERHSERTIDEQELALILENVIILFNDVQQSNLDVELKIFMLDNLESIRRGISEFRIRGPQRLKETLGEIIGTLAVNHEVIQATRNQDAGVVERFEKAFYRLAAVVSFAVDGPALLSAVKVLLLPSGG